MDKFIHFMLGFITVGSMFATWHVMSEIARVIH